jgi:hypothetical protein
MPCEGLDVLVRQTNKTTQTVNTNFQDNILNFPYLTVRVAELENNNFGTDNFLDRSFGVVQYDANWNTDSFTDTSLTTNETRLTKGYVAMIPKFLKCEKVYHPTPLSTLQKMTIDIHRPNGEIVSTTPDTLDILGVIGSNWAGGGSAPYNVNFTPSSFFTGQARYFFIRTSTYFSKLQIAIGDRIQINGVKWDDATLAANPDLQDFVSWINQNEGHLVAGIGYSDPSTNVYTDGANSVGYANYIIIQARYADPTTGSTAVLPFSLSDTQLNTDINTNYANQLVPARLINQNRQLMLVFRIITREMDALPQLRPDNNY